MWRSGSKFHAIRWMKRTKCRCYRQRAGLNNFFHAQHHFGQWSNTLKKLRIVYGVGWQNLWDRRSIRWSLTLCSGVWLWGCAWVREWPRTYVWEHDTVMAADVSVAGIDLASRENHSGARWQDNVAGREVRHSAVSRIQNDKIRN